MGRSFVPLAGLDRPFWVGSLSDGLPCLVGCHMMAPDRTFLWCPKPVSPPAERSYA